MVTLNLFFFANSFLLCLVPFNLVKVCFFNTQGLILQAELDGLNLGQILAMHVGVFRFKLRDQDLVARVDIFDLEGLAGLHHFKLLNTRVQRFQLFFSAKKQLATALKLVAHLHQFLA